LLGTQIVGFAFILSNALTITAMIWLKGDAAGPYYAGLNLVAVASIAFLPWTNGFLWLNVGGIYGPYFLLVALSSSWDAVGGIVVNGFFMGGTLAISLIVKIFTGNLRVAELVANGALQDEIASRGRVIEQKTAESVRLSLLSKQFSPQVVHELRAGKLDLDVQAQRRNICAIFIDIVNSTDRLVRLDKDNIQRVITMYMEDTMRTLLKYDITIDKFLGDGVLAFSNAPVSYDDYIDRVLKAAVEVRTRIMERQKEYIEYWLDDLQIRIGIAAGFANVGFYGSDEYFKTYTAIGRAVNLASRLCAAAEVNQILASNEVAKAARDGEFSMRSLGHMRLKGFEQDLLEVYEVGVKSGERSISTDVTYCPDGHGILHLSLDDRGIYVFACRTCGFRGGESQRSHSTAA
jgi:class 3 adenylate cyclase